MAKKPMKKPPRAPSSDEKSPPPSISPSKKLSAGAGSTSAGLRKHSEPSLKPGVSRNSDDGANVSVGKKSKSKEKEELSGSGEEESADGESSEKRKENEQEVSSGSGSEDGEEDCEESNSRSKSEQPLPPSLPQPDTSAENPIADPSLKPPGSSKSVDGEGKEEGSESEEDQEEEESTGDESSEDFHNKAPKENPPPQPRGSQNSGDDKQASKTSSSSDSGLGNGEEALISDPSLKSVSNKPSDSSARPVEKEPKSGKQSASSPAQISKKKRAAGIARAARGQEKELFKRIWSNEDELALLQGILEYKERHHVIPYSHRHAESLLKSVKNSLSISVSVNQINDKVRRMKKRYKNTTTRQSIAKKSKFSDPHNASVFHLSKRIWNSLKEESILLENKIMLEKKEEGINMKKGESKHFAEEYPSLYWLLKSEHADNALVLQNHIPIVGAKRLEEKCKKLEKMDTELNMQKIELLSSAVKLIKDTLAKY